MATPERSPYRVAIVQVPPVFLDKAATLALAIEKIDEAATAGARLVAFPEAWVPGYPEWVWRLRPGDDYEIATAIWQRFLPQTVDLDADELAPIRQAARRRGVVVTLGISEREGSFSRASVFNTLVVIGADGEIGLRHRKLVPTNPERMVWAPGDGVGLQTVATPLGRVGGLVCWENLMPLARFALYADGVQLWVAPTWDEGDSWITALRHIGFEGRCWVLGAGHLLRASDLPSDLPGRELMYPDANEVINPGDSVIVDPTGQLVEGPLHATDGILYADCDPARASAAHRVLDVAGHYGRPDVFHLTIDRTPRRPVVTDEP